MCCVTRRSLRNLAEITEETFEKYFQQKRGSHTRSNKRRKQASNTAKRQFYHPRSIAPLRLRAQLWFDVKHALRYVTLCRPHDCAQATAFLFPVMLPARLMFRVTIPQLCILETKTLFAITEAPLAIGLASSPFFSLSLSAFRKLHIISRGEGENAGHDDDDDAISGRKKTARANVTFSKELPRSRR